MKRINLKATPLDAMTRPVCERIAAVFAARGHALTAEEANVMWRLYSSDNGSKYAALPDDDGQLFTALKPYFEAAD